MTFRTAPTLRRAGFIAGVLLLGGSLAHADAIRSGPPRRLTDPRSVTAPTLADARPAAIADLHYLRESDDAVWSADGKELFISTNLTGRMNVWKVPVEGGFPLQLTRSEEAQFSLDASRDGRWLAFQSDRAGEEIFDVFVVATAGGEPVNLTRSDDASETAPHFSPDGRWIACLRRGKSEPSQNIALIARDSGKLRLLTAEKDPAMHWSVVGFAADGASLIANRTNIDRTRSAVWRIDLSTGKGTRLSPAGDDRYDDANDLSADGRWISLTTVNARGDHQAALLDVGKRRLEPLHADAWEQAAGRFSPDGKHVLVISNVDGRDRIFEVALADRAVRELPLPAGVNSDYSGSLPSYSPDGRHLLFPHQSGNTPQDYWLFDRADARARRLTRLGLAGLDESRLPPTTIVTYASEDGTPISAVLWMPFNATRDGRLPAVVLPHGGPTFQTRDRFDALAAALATRGYAVIAPNPRGSTGYGNAFQTANRRDLGGRDRIDVTRATRFLIDTGYVDPERIGITGGSYGGFMTLMALARDPEVWAAGVELYGIVNWRTMWENGSPQLRYYQKSLIGDPAVDGKIYDAASPLTYLADTQAPLLVLQGDNDIRVPKGQAVEIVDVLKKAGRTVEAHYYPDEGHGFRKRENQIDATQRTVDWFERYLKR